MDTNSIYSSRFSPDTNRMDPVGSDLWYRYMMRREVLDHACMQKEQVVNVQ